MSYRESLIAAQKKYTAARNAIDALSGRVDLKSARWVAAHEKYLAAEAELHAATNEGWQNRIPASWRMNTRCLRD